MMHLRLSAGYLDILADASSRGDNFDVITSAATWIVATLELYSTAVQFFLDWCTYLSND